MFVAVKVEGSAKNREALETESTEPMTAKTLRGGNAEGRCDP